jgi:hypothetical protein
MSKTAILGLLALLLIPATASAQTINYFDDWSFSFRLGGATDGNGGHNHDQRCWPWDCNDDWSAEGVVAGFELTKYYQNRSAVSLTLEGRTFTDEYVGVAPITVTYKRFLVSKQSSGREVDPGLVILPWIGGGGGIYLHEPRHGPTSVISIGGHAAAGVVIPMGRFFEISGEIRFSVANDFNSLSGVMGFGFRF